ncbi:MAG: ATP synthase F1 subunit gamma [Flavobacteriales bacterium AspAUS03]
MLSLKEIKDRIHSVASITQITGAMKMVSAAKLKKAQEAVIRVRLYAKKIKKLLGALCTVVREDTLQRYTVAPLRGKILYIVVTSNRGLCGAFNSSIVREVTRIVKGRHAEEIQLLTIGKKGKDLLSRKYTLYADWSDLFDMLSFERISEVTDGLIRECLEGTFTEVELVYNRFKNALSQEVIIEKIFPIIVPEVETSEHASDYIFEPSKEVFFHQLLLKALKVQFFRAILESYASEHGARMTAMYKATENASDLKADLILTYNKARQEFITKEILEIVGGVEALNG